MKKTFTIVICVFLLFILSNAGLTLPQTPITTNVPSPPSTSFKVTEKNSALYQYTVQTYTSPHEYCYDFRYLITADNTITVFHFEEDGMQIVIPAEIAGLPITKISLGAFGAVDYLEFIELPDSIVELPETMFSEEIEPVFLCNENTYAWNYALQHGFSSHVPNDYFSSPRTQRSDGNAEYFYALNGFYKKTKDQTICLLEKDPYALFVDLWKVEKGFLYYIEDTVVNKLDLTSGSVSLYADILADFKFADRLDDYDFNGPPHIIDDRYFVVYSGLSAYRYDAHTKTFDFLVDYGTQMEIRENFFYFMEHKGDKAIHRTNILTLEEEIIVGDDETYWNMITIPSFERDIGGADKPILVRTYFFIDDVLYYRTQSPPDIPNRTIGIYQYVEGKKDIPLYTYTSASGAVNDLAICEITENQIYFIVRGEPAKGYDTLVADWNSEDDPSYIENAKKIGSATLYCLNVSTKKVTKIVELGKNFSDFSFTKENVSFTCYDADEKGIYTSVDLPK